ncbi:hypothetical protein DVH05_017505 [Phytophthora capsici]|nr:hypothetical protein DVH05_017505 [Phytophthora capsici]
MDVCSAVRGLTKLQALFRGNKCRQVHVERARNNLPWSPFVPAKLQAVHAMLQVADLQSGEVLVDVGSGDGRIVIEAAVRCPDIGKAVGIELDEALVRLSRPTALRERVVIVYADFMEVDMIDADVVVMFFLPHDEIAELLQQKLRPGTRVITYVFQIAQWKPEKTIPTVPFMTEKGSSSIYLYRVPSSSKSA